MNERIRALTELTLAGSLYPETVHVEFDRIDLLLPRIPREAKQLCEYIRAQRPKLSEYCALTGFLPFDGSVVGPYFTLSGHTEVNKVMKEFYLKGVDNLSTMEWQHASGDYTKVLRKGLTGMIAEIDDSLAAHAGQDEEEAFLRAMRDVAGAIIDYAAACAQEAAQFALTVDEPEYRRNLEQLAEALGQVPARPARSFYEAVLTVYLCFSFNPDSFGTLDRALNDYYEHDISSGALTREDAKAYLQELLLLPQNFNIRSGNVTRGGQSHFCVGGLLPDGSDGFRPLSRLIVESLLELPTCIPEITFRWSHLTTHEDMRYIMDCERSDPFKRIAFTNDERRIQALTQVCGLSFEQAVEYTMCGCNELAFPGSVVGSTSKGNLMHCVETLFHDRADEMAAAESFDAFYALFEQELFKDLDFIYEYDDKYNLARARDYSYVSSLFMKGCIDSGRSLTQAGSEPVVSSPMLMGTVNLIDALIVVKQLVFDEQLLTLRQLADAVAADWAGYEDMRTLILRKTSFFGNDDERSDAVAQRFFHSMYVYLKDKRSVFGRPLLYGDLTGYNEHFKWDGEKMRATPDGRHKGDPLKFGLGQSEGRDHSGLTALLNAIARADPTGIVCGNTITNVTIDAQLMKDEAYFDRTVSLFETYFRMGGVHFQLNYVTREELLEARRCPEQHSSLRVRVTGFSEYFTKLRPAIQDDVIKRTQQR